MSKELYFKFYRYVESIIKIQDEKVAGFTEQEKKEMFYELIRDRFFHVKREERETIKNSVL